MTQATLFIYTETSTHAGTGTGLGAVDLPIQREQTTGYPIIQGSGVKGALRSQYRDSGETEKSIVFGPDNVANGNGSDYAAAVAFGDARVLAFPVRSLKGVFAWVTCRDVLARLQRDCAIAGMPTLLPRQPRVQGNTTESFPSGSGTVIGSEGDGPYDIVLEEYAYSAIPASFSDGAEPDEAADSTQAYSWANWLAQYALPNTAVYREYYAPAFKDRFVILPDDDFRDFTLYATQVVTRIALDREKKTVSGTALFTQELLPADTLLYVPVTVQKPRAGKNIAAGTYFENKWDETGILDWLQDVDKMPLNQRMQIGGDETIGRGFVALRWG
jgi:CRISPR-associated protein Cmr4